MMLQLKLPSPPATSHAATHTAPALGTKQHEVAVKLQVEGKTCARMKRRDTTVWKRIPRTAQGQCEEPEKWRQVPLWPRKQREQEPNTLSRLTSPKDDPSTEALAATGLVPVAASESRELRELAEAWNIQQERTFIGASYQQISAGRSNGHLQTEKGRDIRECLAWSFQTGDLTQRLRRFYGCGRSWNRETWKLKLETGRRFWIFFIENCGSNLKCFIPEKAKRDIPGHLVESSQ
jgi:hypothetical protein